LITRLSKQRARLGESPIWVCADETVMWVDIDGRKICRTELGSGRTDVWSVPGRPGCIGRLADARYLVATERDIIGIALNETKSWLLCKADGGDSNLRFNDGKTDRSGKYFFVGDIYLPRDQAKSKLWCIDSNGRLKSALEGFTTVNGLCWSPEGKTAYISDSPRQRIWAYDFDPDIGDWHSGRLLIETNGKGRPDGAAIDTDGCYWVAMFGGSAILRVTPDGRVERVIKLPVRFPTMVAFGGANLDLMIITTAYVQDGHEQELDGCLLALETGYQGMPEPVFELSIDLQKKCQFLQSLPN